MPNAWGIKCKAADKMIFRCIYGCKVWDLEQQAIRMALMCSIHAMSRFKERFKVFG